jgi:hypothetical protein
MHAHDLALLVGLRLVENERDAGGNIRSPLVSEHDQQVELLVAQPFRPRALDGIPRPAATAVKLATLDREIDLGAARIAGHQLELGAEHVLQKRREIVEVGTGPLAAKHERLGQHVIPGLDRRGVPGGAQAVVVGDVADPGELAAVELGVAQQRLDRHAPRQRADRAAVFRRDVIKILGGAKAPGAGHVLRNECRMARNVSAHIPGQKPRIDVIAAAGAEADDHGNVAAFVEFLDALRARRARQRDCGHDKGQPLGDGLHSHRRPLAGRPSLTSSRRGPPVHQRHADEANRHTGQ